MKKTVYEEMMEDPVFRRLMEQEDRALEQSEYDLQASGSLRAGALEGGGLE